MKKVFFRAITLVSNREKAAVRFKLGKTTLIKGDNDTGKSCLIKSLYWCLGGAVPDIPQPWPQLGVVGILELSIDDREVTFMRRGSTYAVFESDRVIGVFRDVSTGLSSSISELFDFKLKLQGHDEDFSQATPAFLFLPFYVDQDQGWGNLFGSFLNLGQFKSYRKETFQYHFGIRGDRYFELVAERNELGTQLAARQETQRLLAQLRRYTFSNVEQGLTLSLEDFEAELRLLVKDAQSLRDKQRLIETGSRAILVDYEQLKAEQAILKASIKELTYSQEESFVQDAVIECPTCSATYTNDVVARFSIANDVEYCREKLDEVTSAIARIETKLRESLETADSLGREASAVDARMRLTKESIELRHVIQSAGLTSVRKGIDVDIAEADQFVGALVSKIDVVSEQISEVTDRSLARTTTRFYLEKVEALLEELDVSEVASGSSSKYWQRIQQSGSDSPRARLAQAIATLMTTRRNSRSTMFPFVIDSPNQQDQDNFNLESMFGVLIRDVADTTQLIVGGVSGGDQTDFDEVIHLTEARQLLDPNQFDEHAKVLSLLSARITEFENSE